MLKSLSGSWKPVCSVTSYILGSGMVLTAAFLWAIQFPCVWGVLSVFTVGLVFLSAGYTLGRRSGWCGGGGYHV